MNKINLNDNFKQIKNTVMIENELKKNEDYINNFEYKSSLVNVDSRYRIKIPENIITMNNTILPINPLKTTANSMMIQLYIPNHNYIVGDNIIIQNVVGKKIILNNPITLLTNFNYYMVQMNDHNILSSYTMNGNFSINITPYEMLTINDRMINNIPINSIIGIHPIFVYDPSDINTFIPPPQYNMILSSFNITQEELIKNYFFVKLPFNFIQTNSNYYNINKIFQFDFMNIGGISMTYLNANYPINYLQYQSNQEIIQVTSDYVYFNSSVIAVFTMTGGGNNILTGKVINVMEGYPDANHYTIQLKRSFNDVVRIELVSTEIPYVDFNVKNTITLINNKLYWMNLEDGLYIYNITIPEGSYDPNSLITIMQTEMNQVLRIGSTSTNPIYNLFTVILNNNSQEVQFLAYTLINLPNSLNIQQNLSLGDGVVVMTIKQPNNLINVGDTIIISGATKIGDIGSNLINSTFTVYSIDKDTDTYTVLITLTQTYQNINLVGTGGQGIKIKIPTYASFIFTYNNTIGNILGFKNVGSPNAITPFSYITSNFNNYILPTPYNEVGNSNGTSYLLNLSGDFYYMLLYVNDYEGIIMTNANIDNAFSKILMIGNSGDIMFNTFINSPLEFDIPLSSLNELKIKFAFPDNSLPDFRNFDHSFTMRIVERITKPIRTGLNSHKITYIDSMKDIAIHK